MHHHKVPMTEHSYGKEEVRVLIGQTSGDDTIFREVIATILLKGGFQDAFADGNNSTTLPSDSLKHHLVAVARLDQGSPLEDLGEKLLRQLSRSLPHADEITARLKERYWNTGQIESGKHGTKPYWQNFEVTVSKQSNKETRFGGSAEWNILRSKNSSFSGFLRDTYTIQEDSPERILAGKLALNWEFLVKPNNPTTSRETLGSNIEKSFHTVQSRSVQETLYGIAQLAFITDPNLGSLELSFSSISLTETGNDSPQQVNSVWIVSEYSPSFTKATFRNHELGCNHP